MKTVSLNETLYVQARGEAEYGVLVAMERRDGEVVTVQKSWHSLEANDERVRGLTVVTEGDAFVIEGVKPVYMHMGYDEEEGYPLLVVAPRSMVG